MVIGSLMCVLFALLITRRNASRRRIPQRIMKHRERVKNELMKHVECHDKQCYYLFHMGPKSFLNLCTILRNRGGLQPIRFAIVKEPVAKFLYFIGHNV